MHDVMEKGICKKDEKITGLCAWTETLEGIIAST